MKQSNPFRRAIAMFAAIAAVSQARFTAVSQARFTAEQFALANGRYKSRGKGEGCPGNKYAKSSFKQNKRRGL